MRLSTLLPNDNVRLTLFFLYVTYSYFRVPYNTTYNHLLQQNETRLEGRNGFTTLCSMESEIAKNGSIGEPRADICK